ncbi:MAG: AAA family ATPase [Candidatus Hydrogenedentes bacterium]|nr:AAA family ATPase [Candidatus Hydrogenedentota bacterium]
MDGTQSYLKLLGLKEQPFAPTADPVYFYATREHKECLFRLWNSVDNCHGIAVVLGSYGTGKTTLLRKLITGMTVDPTRYKTAVIGSPIPSWTSFALLESIVAQFGVQPAQHSFVAYMEALNRCLLDNRDKICTLIIDDAQNLNKRGQLELLRLVQNLETQQRKLINLVFFAQLEWMQVLRAAPNFEQRINMTYTLPPLSFDEVRNFIEFRLQQAGAGPGEGPQFEEAALHAIYAYGEGSPRVTVTLCRNALLVAAQLRSLTVTHDMIVHTIEKTTLPDPEKRGRVAAAIQECLKGQQERRPPVFMEPAPLPPQPARQGSTREQRAEELLLRAARSRQA